MTNKVCVLSVPNHGIELMMKHLGYTVTVDIDHLNPDCIVFPGGEDVSPIMYYQKKSKVCGQTNFRRDIREARLFQRHSDKVLKIGICRGAQFLNVMNGGTLIQHLNNHTRDHDIFIHSSGKRVKVTSTHHQAMIPSRVYRSSLIASANESTEKWIDGKKIESQGVDAEIVYYPESNSFCFQPHPEYDLNGTTFELFKQQLQSLN
jgi:gamma-glutamyl-gamma-aminobutyrate hydrolase PuuD